MVERIWEARKMAMGMSRELREKMTFLYTTMRINQRLVITIAIR